MGRSGDRRIAAGGDDDRMPHLRENRDRRDSMSRNPGFDNHPRVGGQGLKIEPTNHRRLDQLSLYHFFSSSANL